MLLSKKLPPTLQQHGTPSTRSRKRLHASLFVVLLLLLLIGVNAPSPTYAQTRSFYWESYNVDIQLLENGDMLVEETQTLVFSGGTYSFGFGTIPTGTAGNNDEIVDISVREGNVQYTESRSNLPNTFMVDRSSDEVAIEWFFEPATGKRTYTFSYRVIGGVIVGSLDEGSGDQIFWKAIPSDHPTRIDNSRVTVRLPEGIAVQQYLDGSGYLAEGYVRGDVDAALVEVSENGRMITVKPKEAIPAGQEVEVRVQFPHGLLSIPVPDWQKRQERADTAGLVITTISILILVIGSLTIISLWYARGRDPELKVTVPEYLTEPPSDLPPAVVGTLIDEKADMHDILSIMIDLSKRGYMRIEDNKGHKFIRTDKTSDAGLRPFESTFLKALFGKKRERSLKDLKYKFANNLSPLRDGLYEELVNQELVPKSPEAVRNSYGCLSFAGLIGGVILTMFLPGLTNAGAALICPGLSIGLVSLVLMATARHMPTKSEKGVEEAAKWEAFRTYLRNVERYEDLDATGEIFEKYLGYAVAFGIERTWIRKFSAIPTTPIPGWYHMGPRPHHGRNLRPYSTGGSSGGGATPSLEGMSGSLTGGLANMSGSFTRMLTSSSTTFKSTRSSSSSSGSSGGFSGGFSGGGGFSSGGGGSRGFG